MRQVDAAAIMLPGGPFCPVTVSYVSTLSTFLIVFQKSFDPQYPQLRHHILEDVAAITFVRLAERWHKDQRLGKKLLRHRDSSTQRY